MIERQERHRVHRVPDRIAGVKLSRMVIATLATAVLGGAWDRAVHAAPPAAADALFAEGQALFEAKKFAEAAPIFERVVAADAGNANAWYRLAAARRQSGHCDRAVVAYRRYLSLVATQPDPYYGLGLCLRDTGDRAGALQALQHYITIEKREKSRPYLDYARQVIADLSGPPAAAAAPPPAPPPASVSPANAAYVEAQSLRDQGHIDESIAKFKQAIAADARFMPARAALGELYIKIRHDDEAITVFRAAVDKNPTYPLAWYDLAFALRAKGRMADAVAAYERYIKLRPDDPDPYYGLGRALQQLGRAAAARQAFETYVAMEKNPNERRWVESAEAQLRALSPPR
jgi:tetratricopeptide (TPR) repeat protein